MSKSRSVVYIALSILFATACKPSAQTNGETPEPELREASVAPEPGAVSAGKAPVSIAVSSTHGCARHGDGAVSCWPLPEYERDDDMIVRVMPSGPEVEASMVDGVADATELVAGDTFVCVKRAGGSVDCWDPGEGAPTKIMEAADRIDAYGTAVCKSTDETVICATAGESGFTVAEPMTMPKEVVQVEVGGEVVCVRYADETAECRKLPGVTEEPQLEPGIGREGSVVALENVSEIDAGDHYVCARIEEQQHCWGEGFGGRGEVAHTVLQTKKLVFFPGARFVVTSGNRITRASIIADKPSYRGQWRGKKLGLTTMATSALLTGFDPSDRPTERFSEDTVGFHGHRLCVIQPDGAIGCAIEKSDFTKPAFPIVQTPTKVPVEARFDDVASVGTVTYATDTGEDTWAMGMETKANERYPNWWSGIGYVFMKPTNLGLSQIEGLHGFGELALVRSSGEWEAITGHLDPLPEAIRKARTLHSSSGRLLCAQKAPGAVVCIDSMSWMPTDVELPGKLVDVALSSLIGVCFLNDEGDVYCDAQFMRQGDGEEAMKPAKVGVSGVTRMASMRGGICVAKTASDDMSDIRCGTVKAKDGGAARAELTTVATLENLQELDDTVGAVCAIYGDDKLTCWGSNRLVTLHDKLVADAQGNPAESTPEDGMKVFAEVPPVAELALSKASSCALTTDGNLWCWGNNASGATGRIPPYISKVKLER